MTVTLILSTVLLEACKCIGVHILLPIQFFVVSFLDSERISEMILPQEKDETFLEVLSQTIQSKLIVIISRCD